MSGYSDKVLDNLDKLEIKIMKIIDNETARITYSIQTNLSMDFGICQEFMSTLHTTKKSKFDRKLNYYKNLTKFKIKMIPPENSLGFTRIVYIMKKGL